MNQQARLLGSTHQPAAVFTAHQAFRNAGIPVEIEDSFGITDRIVQADALYRQGHHQGATEADVLKAVNGFVDHVQAPAWAHTTPQELRKLRMRLLVLYPQLMASKAPADSKGNYRAVEATMSPIEATHLATHMIFQKIENAEYQLSDQEKALDAGTTQRLHFQRMQAMKTVAAGLSNLTSMQDILSYTDRFFSDLGIEAPSRTASVNSGASSMAMMQKGGR